MRESEKHKRELLSSLKVGMYQCEPGVDEVLGKVDIKKHLHPSANEECRRLHNETKIENNN